MTLCDTATIQLEDNTSTAEVVSVTAEDGSVGDVIPVDATLENIIVEGDGEVLMVDVRFYGMGDERTTTTEINPGKTKTIKTTLAANESGTQEICAEVV